MVPWRLALNIRVDLHTLYLHGVPSSPVESYPMIPFQLVWVWSLTLCELMPTGIIMRLSTRMVILFLPV